MYHFSLSLSKISPCLSLHIVRLVLEFGFKFGFKFWFGFGFGLVVFLVRFPLTPLSFFR